MTFDVIMPALGMAQDTGLLVAWRKAPGDVVTADEVLMEVETDKSTIEVPAGHDGYVAELRARAGEDVPVGQVVAVITAEKPDLTAAAARPAAASAPELRPVPAPSPPSPRPARPAPVVVSPPPAAVRARPRAGVAEGAAPGVGKEHRPCRARGRRRFAADPRQGYRLAAGVCDAGTHRRGVSRWSQPAAIPPLSAVSSTGSAGRLIALEPHVLVAGFCAASLRAVTQAKSIVVAVQIGLDGRRVAYLDPDFTRASRPRLAGQTRFPA